MNQKVVHMKDICLQIDQQVILDHAEISLEAGQVCSILGENGAGKTTLMKVLAGVHRMDSGSIFYEGKEAEFDTIIDSKNHGIQMIFQEPNLVPEFSVKENIFLGNEICYPGTSLINEAAEWEKANEIMGYLWSNIDIERKVSQLSFAEKKIVEIARALSTNVRVLILDEITASFTQSDTRALQEVLNKLKKQNVAIVFISHKLEEVMDFADSIVIMRDGRTVDAKTANIRASQEAEDILIKMAGKDYRNRYPKTRAKKGKVVLRLENIANDKRTVLDASLYIRSGEIVGIAGLQGAGKSSLAKLLSGAEKPVSGDIYLDEEPLRSEKMYDFVEKGIVYLSDACFDNLVLHQDIQYNITLPSIAAFEKMCLIDKKKCENAAEYYIQKLALKHVTPYKQVRYLSSGMQQKVALSKWLCADARVYVLDEPTISLDTVSKVELYNIMNQIVQNKKSIFIASSDLGELLGMCDRIYVMYGGRIVAEMDSKEANSLRVLEYASGKAVNKGGEQNDLYGNI